MRMIFQQLLFFLISCLIFVCDVRVGQAFDEQSCYSTLEGSRLVNEFAPIHKKISEHIPKNGKLEAEVGSRISQFDEAIAKVKELKSYCQGRPEETELEAYLADLEKERLSWNKVLAHISGIKLAKATRTRVK